jgi:hypothetical protein
VPLCLGLRAAVSSAAHQLFGAPQGLLNLSGEIQRLETRLDSSTEKSEALDIPPWVNRPRSNLLTGLIRGGREGYEDTEGVIDDRWLETL